MPQQGLERGKPALAGDQGVWIFILFDLCFFGLLFLSFVLGQIGDPAAFAVSRLRLHIDLGLLNTLLLLTSSWFVALAIQAGRRGDGARVSRLLGLTIICGLGFLVIKAFDYAGAIRAGLSPLTSDFFMFYFITTFLHAVHVVAGLGLLRVTMKNSGRPDTLSGSVRWLESVGIIWHMVDLLWVMIFALFYLVSWA